MKTDIQHLKNENQILLMENSKVVKSKGGVQLKDTMKKLKKRELECAALWDTFKDMYLADGDKYDKKHLEKLFAV